MHPERLRGSSEVVKGSQESAFVGEFCISDYTTGVVQLLSMYSLWETALKLAEISVLQE